MLGLSDFLEGVDEQSWMVEGVCAQTDPEAFFPPPGAPARDAKSICGRCEVRADCLEYALSLPYEEDFGVWGGLSRVARRKIRRERKQAAEREKAAEQEASAA